MSWKLYYGTKYGKLCVMSKEPDKYDSQYQHIADIGDIKITKKTESIYFILPISQHICYGEELPKLNFASPFFTSMNKLRDWIRDDNLKDVRWKDLGTKDYYVNFANIIR